MHGGRRYHSRPTPLHSCRRATVSDSTMGMPIRVGFVEHDGESIYFETVGDSSGPVIVLTHGMGGNHMIWYQQVAYFAPACRVITWDQRGFGRSTNNSGNASPQKSATDLATVLQHLEVETAHVIGQSLGGWASLGFALRNPARVRSLVLSDTVAGIHSGRIEGAFREHAARAASASMQQQAAPIATPFDYHPALWSGFSARNSAQAFLYNQISSVSPAPPVATLSRQLPQSFWPSDELARMAIPTLFVVGEHDDIFPPALIREAASQITGATVREIPLAGHSPYFETPDEWNRTVRDFIKLHG